MIVLHVVDAFVVCCVFIVSHLCVYAIISSVVVHCIYCLLFFRSSLPLRPSLPLRRSIASSTISAVRCWTSDITFGHRTYVCHLFLLFASSTVSASSTAFAVCRSHLPLRPSLLFPPSLPLRPNLLFVDHICLCIYCIFHRLCLFNGITVNCLLCTDGEIRHLVKDHWPDRKCTNYIVFHWQENYNNI